MNVNYNSEHPPLTLIAGATGYVGGRLLQELEDRGCRVRCMARRPEFLSPRVSPETEVVAGDVLERSSLDAPLRGVDAAYYLVHSMGASGSFQEKDRQGARNFGEAARAAGVRRIIYVGGLGSAEEELSAHLRSRQEVGEILRESSVPVIEFRASIVIGSGSLSFELIRALVERLPIMITPRWVSMTAQPIAIEDLIAYLTAALDLPDGENRIFEIGGADQVSYAGIMRAYGRCRGIRVRMIPVPALTPYLSSLWLGLVTPVYARIGRKLIESIVHPTVVEDDAALRVFDVRPMGIDAALRRALANEDQRFAATRWSNALSSTGDIRSWGGVRFGSRLVDSRTAKVRRPPEIAFRPIQRIGGDTGWYAWNALWRVRGWLDTLVGGVGLRRGRTDREMLRIGDTVDFWRVELFEPGRRLRLFAEMRLPGRAWLEFEVTGKDGAGEVGEKEVAAGNMRKKNDGGVSTIRQTAIFDPVGIFGRLYWYALFPLHQIVFRGMLRNIVKAAEKEKKSKGQY